jgi:predicted RecB family nuclease
MRMDQGIAFEADVVARLAAAAPAGWVFIDETLPGDECRALTTEAMQAGAPVIVGANLHADFDAKRSGKPDLLVWHEDGYVPIDVKHHLTLNVADSGVALVSPLATPTPSALEEREGWERRRHKGDALQLAHYRRMLEATGHAATSAWAGIIGKEGEVVWYVLDEVLWQTPAKSDGKKRKMRTTLEIYDFEFDFRRDIAAVATDHLDDPTAELIVEPMRCGECATCPWDAYCSEQLEAGSGDTSLLPGLQYPQWRELRDADIRTRQQVAGLDMPTVELAVEGLNVEQAFREAVELPGDAPAAGIMPKARKQQSVMASHCLHTAGALVRAIDPITASLGSYLRHAIPNAVAALGDAPAYIRNDEDNPSVPRGSVELDIDMESTNDGVYQWGVLVTDPGNSGLVETGYRPFITWDPLTPESELALFIEFWTWLEGVRSACAEAGVPLRGYCWHRSAEETHMRRLAATDPDLAADVKAFIDSSEWVDLEQVLKDQWITGGSTSLKTIAPLAGFTWPVDDPGGALSMVHHQTAADPDDPGHEEARQWLLDYNRGDVEATLAIRTWLDAEGHAFPTIDEAITAMRL